MSDSTKGPAADPALRALLDDEVGARAARYFHGPPAPAPHPIRAALVRARSAIAALRAELETPPRTVAGAGGRRLAQAFELQDYEEAAALLAALDARAPRWEPIDRAPHGEPVLLYFPADRARMLDEWIKVDVHPVTYPRKPTLFCYLPALPATLRRS